MKALLVYQVECKGAKTRGWTGNSRPYQKARIQVYKALLLRHRPDLILRHINTIVNVLDRARDKE